MRSSRFTRWSWFVLALLAVALSNVPAGASSKKTVTAVPLTEEELARLPVSLAGFSCALGVTNTPLSSLDYIIPPDDMYFTLIQPNQCAACAGTNSAYLSVAHIVLNVRVACTMPIEYAIVGADTGCTEPDLNNLICPVIPANLAPPGIGLQDFALPLPDSCKFTGPAFLFVNFKSFPTGCNTSSNRPLLVLATGGCPGCRSYNYFETDKADLCKQDTLPGQPQFYVEASSCYTPTLRKTWGSLKIRYR